MRLPAGRQGVPAARKGSAAAPRPRARPWGCGCGRAAARPARPVLPAALKGLGREEGEGREGGGGDDVWGLPVWAERSLLERRAAAGAPAGSPPSSGAGEPGLGTALLPCRPRPPPAAPSGGERLWAGRRGPRSLGGSSPGVRFPARVVYGDAFPSRQLGHMRLFKASWAGKQKTWGWLRYRSALPRFSPACLVLSVAWPWSRVVTS